jgi:amidase
MLDRTPCGSSSGSGAATAASLAAASVGTETNGSVICPSNVNGVVGFKPGIGLVAQQGIIPISHSQDTAGPMTKTVRGAAMMLTAMSTGEGAMDFEAALDETSLSGKRVGVLRFSVGENSDIQDRFDAALEVLKAQGAELVEITEFEPVTPEFGRKSFDILTYEFKAGLNAYFAGTPDSVSVKSLLGLIAFNEEHADIELSLFNQDIFKISEGTPGLEDETYLSAVRDVQKAVREDGLDRLIADFQVDFLVSPSGPVAPRVDPVNGDVWPAWSGAGSLAAKAGYPHLSVPMGDVHGIPLGLSFFGRAGQDADILSYGYAFEQVSHLRRDPRYLATAEDRPEIASAMSK